jgi:AbrB family looped-hinge helix DNA binding protein
MYFAIIFLLSFVFHKKICYNAKQNRNLLDREAGMATTVKVNSRYQISIPRIARQQLNVKKGDRLLIDVQGNMIILVPQPDDYVAHLTGLHKEVWQDVDTDKYLRREREAWISSENA